MLFVGDVAVDKNSVFEIDTCIFEYSKVTVANLEGLIIEDSLIKKNDNAVYNTNNTIKYLKEMHVGAVSLANNHITDVPHEFDYTKRILEDNQIKYFGAGVTKEDANKEVILWE